MDLEPDDELISAKLANDSDDMILITAKGQSLRFSVKTLRSASRLSGGVRGIKLGKDDSVVGMEPALLGEAVLVTSVNGMGKRTAVEDYPRQGRGGMGVITFRTTPKSGDLVMARTVHPEYELMLISEEGIILRTPVNHISLQGRSTQGVTLMDVSRGDRVSAIATVDMRREFQSKDLPTGASIGNGDGADTSTPTKKKSASKSKGTKSSKPAKPEAKGKGGASAKGGKSPKGKSSDKSDKGKKRK